MKGPPPHKWKGNLYIEISGAHWPVTICSPYLGAGSEKKYKNFYDNNKTIGNGKIDWTLNYIKEPIFRDDVTVVVVGKPSLSVCLFSMCLLHYLHRTPNFLSNVWCFPHTKRLSVTPAGVLPFNSI